MVWLKSVGLSLVGALAGLWLGAIPALILVTILSSADLMESIGSAVVVVVVWASCILIGAFFGFNAPLSDEREKRQAQETEARREQQRRESELRNRIDRLSGLLTDSRKELPGLREMVPAAERHLDRAEQEFAEGAFAPFWDQIEHATNELVAYQHSIKAINRKAIQYRKDAADLPGQVPPFDLPKLPDHRSAKIRLESIARKAQKDFHFALIFEQRKTNKILIEGFGTLASAIYAIGDSITSSLNDLASNLDTSLDELLEETREHSRQAQFAADWHAETLAERSRQEAAETTKRRQFERELVESQKEQVRILDNIQRGRKPLP